MRDALKHRLAREASNWRHQGLIDAELAARLSERYRGGDGALSLLLRWLGFLALFLLGTALLGLVGMAFGQAGRVLMPVAVAAVAFAAWQAGRLLVLDPGRRYPLTGTILLTFGLLCVFAALLLTATAFELRLSGDLFMTIALTTAALALATAYRYALRWPLVLGLLLVFHGLGHSHGYLGGGAYVLGIREPLLVLAVGAGAVALGWWHERVPEDEARSRLLGFGHWYIVFGLLYLNLNCWLLSLDPGGLPWVLLFTGVGIAQIVLGARVDDSRLIGYGIVFLALDLYTRFFERFWDDWSKSAFFLVGGLSALALGAVFEWRARRLGAVRPPGAPP